MPDLSFVIRLSKSNQPAGHIPLADPSPEVWEPALPTVVAAAAFTGRLEAVDLRRGWFRVTDQAGTDVELTEVGEPLETARLIGGIVTASGDLRDSGGRL